MPNGPHSRRLFIMLFGSLLFALPFIVIVNQAVTNLNSQVEFSRKEQFGVLYHKDLLGFFQLVQELRGLTFMAQNGNKEAAGKIEFQKKDVIQTAADFENNNGSFGRMLGVDQGWLSIRDSIMALSAEKKTQSPAEEFKAYTDICDSILNLMNDVVDASNLQLDPALETGYLAEATVIATPKIMYTMGKMRGLTSGYLASGALPKRLTEKQFEEMQILYFHLNAEDAEILQALRRAHPGGDDSFQPVIDHKRIIEPQLEEFKKRFETVVFRHQNDLSSSDFFELGTESIDAYGALYDSVTTGFLVLLKKRQSDYTVKKNLVLFSSTLGSLGFVALFIFLYRSLSRSERTELQVKRYSAELEKQKGELVNAKALADSANTAKSDFLANMSHELRTPLNSILGLTRMLYEDEGMAQEYREMVGIAYRAADNLLDLVNDILDLSKVEAGELVLENITFSLQEVVDGVMETMLPLNSAKGLDFACHMPDGNIPYLMGDPVRLGRVFVNLIGNAIKYTERGSITVDVECQPAGSGKVMVSCSVKDTGIGIPAEKQGLIFDKFAQGDSSITRKFGGTGLGLHITRKLVEKMGGEIGVESEVGKGSRFWYRIPFATADTRPLIDKKSFKPEDIGRLPASQRKNIEDMRILMAEDYLLNQVFMQKLCTRMGIRSLDIVDNGQAVMDALAGNTYDLILMDCHMPVMSGYDATMAIRRLEKGTDKHIPIIAMTADAMVGTKERCLKAGMDNYISKPINSDELRHLLSRWITFADEAAETGAADTSEDTLFDLNEVRKYADSKEELQEFIKTFVSDSDEILKILHENCGNGHIPAWTEAAHKLKGGAGMLKAEKLRALCETAQHMKIASAANRLQEFRKIEAAYAALKEALSRHKDFLS